MSAPLVRRLPLAPLVHAVGERERHVTQGIHTHQRPQSSACVVAELSGVSRRTVVRWRHYGIDVWSADRAACALGLHPWAIWGDEWLQLQLHELLDAEEAV